MSESAQRAQRGDTKLGRLALEVEHLYERGSYDKAAKKLLKRMGEFKDHPDLHILYALLATIYRDNNDVPRAAEAYLKVVGLTQGSVASLTRQSKAPAPGSPIASIYGTAEQPALLRHLLRQLAP